MAKAAARKLNKRDQAELENGFKQAILLTENLRLQEAKNLCESLLQTYGNDSRILNQLGVIAYRGGDPNLAIGYFKRLLDADPTNTEALWNLANLLSNLGYREQAIEMYESILTHDPKHQGALKEINRLCFLAGQMEKSFLAGARLGELDSTYDGVWNYMIRASSQISPSILDSKFMQQMATVLEDPSSNWIQALRLALLAVDINYPIFSACLRVLNTQGEVGLDDMPVGQLRDALNIPLLHAMLRSYVVPNAILERFLTLMRSRLLFLPEDEKLEDYLDLLITLAFQGYVNEYAYYRSPEEQTHVDRLCAELEADSLTTDAATVSRLLLLATYTPLVSLPIAEKLSALAKAFGNKDFRRFITVAVEEVLEEREIAKTIPALAMSEDEVSQAVREQYEENPYPRWIGLGEIPAESTSRLLRRLFPLFDQTQIEMSDAPEILVAGCGTGKHAVSVVRRFKNSKMIAVDLSRASLAYAIRKTREYKIKNIDYYQADILNLGALDRTFDIVESAGVLHHMRDPMEGWRVLVDLVKPGGLMKIGLYSSTARAVLTEERKRIKAEGYGDSPEEIRRYRHEMMQDPAMAQKYSFTISNDFYSLSECRDLLFHRQEHCTNLLEIKERLKALGMTFIGFEMTNLEYIEKYIERFPEDRHWNNLDNWHALEQENPLMFFGMYQFWCYKPL